MIVQCKEGKTSGGAEMRIALLGLLLNTMTIFTFRMPYNIGHMVVKQVPIFSIAK